MRLSRLIIILAVVAVITAGIIISVVSWMTQLPKGSQTLPYQFMVSDTVGVDTGHDILRLGAVTAGGSGSWRTVLIQDTLSSSTSDNVTRKFRVVAVGEGASWITITPDVVTVPAEINVSLRVPAGSEKKTYRGTLVVSPLAVSSK